MFKEKRLLFLIAETPLHPGSGSEVGIVDLPIQREKHTEFPKIESSTLRGCLREAIESSNKQIKLNDKQIRPKDKITYKFNNVEKETDYVSLVFGPEGEETHAGALTLTDARILLFPVKSLKGVFAWITCPMVLERFKRDLKVAGLEPKEIMDEGLSKLLKKIPPVKIPPGSTLTVNNNVVLEEYTFGVEEEKEKIGKLAEWFAANIYPNENEYSLWKSKLEKDIVILPDDDFTQFVRTSTEIVTRTKIDSVTGTVQSGALWTEEYLPQDTIMYSLAMFTAPRVENDEQKGVFKANTPEEEARLVAEFFKEGLPDVIQIGGNQTIGKGFVILNLYKEA
ncbi:MAG: type III-B CRISPR module RAMP protein Cmr4 [candidate division WOR-3 bacterium]